MSTYSAPVEERMTLFFCVREKCHTHLNTVAHITTPDLRTQTVGCVSARKIRIHAQLQVDIAAHTSLICKNTKTTREFTYYRTCNAALPVHESDGVGIGNTL